MSWTNKLKNLFKQGLQPTATPTPEEKSQTSANFNQKALNLKEKLKANQQQLASFFFKSDKVAEGQKPNFQDGLLDNMPSIFRQWIIEHKNLVPPNLKTSKKKSESTISSQQKGERLQKKKSREDYGDGQDNDDLDSLGYTQDLNFDEQTVNFELEDRMLECLEDDFSQQYRQSMSVQSKMRIQKQDQQYRLTQGARTFQDKGQPDIFKDIIQKMQQPATAKIVSENQSKKITQETEADTDRDKDEEDQNADKNIEQQSKKSQNSIATPQKKPKKGRFDAYLKRAHRNKQSNGSPTKKLSNAKSESSEPDMFDLLFTQDKSKKNQQQQQANQNQSQVKVQTNQKKLPTSPALSKLYSDNSSNFDVDEGSSGLDQNSFVESSEIKVQSQIKFDKKPQSAVITEISEAKKPKQLQIDKPQSTSSIQSSRSGQPKNEQALTTQIKISRNLYNNQILVNAADKDKSSAQYIQPISSSKQAIPQSYRSKSPSSKDLSKVIIRGGNTRKVQSSLQKRSEKSKNSEKNSQESIPSGQLKPNINKAYNSNPNPNTPVKVTFSYSSKDNNNKTSSSFTKNEPIYKNNESQNTYNFKVNSNNNISKTNNVPFQYKPLSDKYKHQRNNSNTMQPAQVSFNNGNSRTGINNVKTTQSTKKLPIFLQKLNRLNLQVPNLQQPNLDKGRILWDLKTLLTTTSSAISVLQLLSIKLLYRANDLKQFIQKFTYGMNIGPQQISQQICEKILLDYFMNSGWQISAYKKIEQLQFIRPLSKYQKRQLKQGPMENALISFKENVKYYLQNDRYDLNAQSDKQRYFRLRKKLTMIEQNLKTISQDLFVFWEDKCIFPEAYQTFLTILKQNLNVRGQWTNGQGYRGNINWKGYDKTTVLYQLCEGQQEGDPVCKSIVGVKLLQLMKN